MSPVSECEVDENEVKSTIATSEKQIQDSGFADGRKEMSPVSECEVDENEVKSTIATSEKQIQDSGFFPL